MKLTKETLAHLKSVAEAADTESTVDVRIDSLVTFRENFDPQVAIALIERIEILDEQLRMQSKGHTESRAQLSTCYERIEELEGAFESLGCNLHCKSCMNTNKIRNEALEGGDA